MLREVEMLDPLWHTAVLMHHERRDGRGYAFGVHDSEIPALARLIHLLDIVAAKLMPRSYRPSVAPKQALAALYAGEMESFDPLYITQLVKILGIYPPGSFIELQNGDHALVVKNGDSAATPLVVSIKSPDHPIDTAQAGYHVKQSVSLSLEARHLPLFYRYWS
jgi:HD-GYP domain-containing protein (c-di-GMP phosphodiesterase class II)